MGLTVEAKFQLGSQLRHSYKHTEINSLLEVDMFGNNELLHSKDLFDIGSENEEEWILSCMYY